MSMRKDFHAVKVAAEEVSRHDKGFVRIACVEDFKSKAATFFLRHGDELEEKLWPITEEMTTEPADHEND